MADGAIQCGLVLLAAGASTRMGQPKQLLEIDSEPLVRRAAKAALASSARPVAVVLGAHATRIRPHLVDLPLVLVENSGWAQGMSSSLRAGLRALNAAAPQLDAAIIALADQPHFSADLAGRLLAEQRRSGQSIVACRSDDHTGPPVLFLKKHFPELLALQGDDGARAVLKSRAPEVAIVDVPDAVDLDAPADYDRYVARKDCGCRK